MGEFEFPLSRDIFSTIIMDGIDWPFNKRYLYLCYFQLQLKIKHLSSENRGKEWSANQFIRYWGTFLQREDATSDPQYSMIRGMFETATKASNNAAESKKSTTTKGQRKKQSKSN